MKIRYRKLLTRVLPKKNGKPISRKERAIKHLTNVGFALLTLILTTAAPVAAAEIDEAATVLGNEGGKQALSEALKLSKTKPALSLAAAITCLACVPVAGAAASPAMCIACGILISKVLG